MPENFKDQFSHAQITKMARAIAQNLPDFPVDTFITLATANLEQLAMKARSQQIVAALRTTLPKDFRAAGTVLVQSLQPVLDEKSVDPNTAGWTNNLHTAEIDGIGSWLIMPTADFIGQQGQHDVSFAMDCLHAMTKRFSAEFGIRHLLKNAPEQTLTILHQWCNDPCQHVRRLISEGSRPLLPWGLRLQKFLHEPKYTLPLLEKLKDDSSDYVRLSVSNHLNDIAKQHPDVVNQITQKWQQSTGNDRIHQQRSKLLKHACRTLIKQGNPQTLALWGFAQAEIDTELSLNMTEVMMGDDLIMGVTLVNPLPQEQNILLDYVVYHQKANGQLTPRVCKWKSFIIGPNQSLTLNKKHSFKPVTTRKYYPGKHQVALQINGVITNTEDFYLVQH